MIGNSRLTSTGQTMGTVRYMSPEQVRGKAADARSDIYSLGITLYEALCGTTPFDGENHFDIMQQHLRNKPPSLAKMGATVPASVEKALMVALEKGAAERYADAAAFRAALEKVLPDVPRGSDATIAQSVGGPRKSRLAPALGLAVLVAGGAGATFLAARHFAKKPVGSSGLGVGSQTQSSRPNPRPNLKPPTPNPQLPTKFLTPHSIAGLTVATDERFEADGVRVQSTQKRDAAKVRDAYRNILAELRLFLGSVETPAARALAASELHPAPLNIVVVPQSMLDAPALWPSFPLTAGSTYPSRYVPEKRTVFVNDGSGFERSDLPFPVANHVLYGVTALSDQDVLRLSEKFELYYNSKSAR
jgi:serine/threonine protein kinase